MPNTYSLISSNVLTSSAASVTFSAIPSTYTDLVLRTSTRIYVDGSTTSYPFNVSLNGTGTTSFSETLIRVSSTTNPSVRTTGQSAMTFNYTPAELATANTFASGEHYIPSYTASQNKPFSGVGHAPNNALAGFMMDVNAGLYSSTSAVTSITCWNASTFTFVAGSSFYLYGISNS